MHALASLPRALSPLMRAFHGAHPDTANHPDSSWKLPAGHVPALDGVRGLAILLVLITHGIDAALRPSGPVEQSLYHVARWGWIGVDLFFVLSGFLITGILLDTRGKPNCLGNFFARRSLRIFPLYYGTILVTLVLLPLVPGSRFDGLRDLASQQPWFWLHASNYYKILCNHPPIGWLSTLWSLAVEEHFYLVWPFVVLGLSTPRLLRVCLGLILAPLALRVVLAASGCSGDCIYRGTLTRVDPLLMGAALAILARTAGGLPRLIGLSHLVVVGCLAALFAQMIQRNGGHGRDTTFYGMTLQYSVVGLLFSGLLVLLLTSGADSGLRRLFTWEPLLVLGKYSYALYILNKPCYSLIREFLRPAEWTVWGSQLPAVMVFVLAGCLVTFLGAQVTWRLLEKPCLDLKRRFEHREATRAA